MNRKILPWVAAMMALAIGPSAFAAETKVGHVDLMRVLDTYRQSDSASIRLREEVDRKRKEFEIKRAEIESMREAIKQQESILSEEELAEKALAASEKKSELITIVNEAQRDIKAKEEFLQSTISEAVRSALQEVAKEGHYHYILDAGQRPVLFAEDSLDVTDEVLKKLSKDQ